MLKCARESRSAALLCIGMQQPRNGSGNPDVAAIAACRHLLAYARALGWTVIHSHSRGELGAYAAAPVTQSIPGLEPLPSEPVHLQAGLSALNARVLDLLDSRCEEDIWLAGFLTPPCLLSTLLAGVERGLRIGVVADATCIFGNDGMPSNELRGILARLTPSPAHWTNTAEIFRTGAFRLAANQP